MMEAKVVGAPFSYKTDAIFHYWQEVGGGGEVRQGRYQFHQLDDAKHLLTMKNTFVSMIKEQINHLHLDVCYVDPTSPFYGTCISAHTCRFIINFK